MTPRLRLAFLAFLAVPLVVMAQWIGQGSIVNHSSQFNTPWALGFAEQLRAGQLYPRWLPLSNGGLGSPAFYFYAPLPFYLTAPLVWVTGSGGLAVVLGSTLMLGLSGLAAYVLFRSFASPTASLVAAVLYMIMPYHLAVDVWVRGAYGEQAAFIFIPLAMAALLRLGERPEWMAGLALSYAALVLSHLPSTLVASPFLGLLALWLAVKQRSPKPLVRSGIAVLLGIAAASIYLQPALEGRSFIKPEFWQVIAVRATGLGNFSNVFEKILWGGLIPLAGVMALCIADLRRVGAAREAMPWLVMMALVLFLVSPLAGPLWDHAGLFGLIQFSWRTFAILEIAACALVAQAIAAGGKGARLALPIMAAALLGLWQAINILSTAKDPATNSTLQISLDLQNRLLRLRADPLEYLPACAEVKRDSSDVTMSTATTVERTHPSGRQLPYFWYPFLHAYDGAGNEVPTTCDPETGLMTINNDLTSSSSMTVRRAALPVERAAALESLAGLLGIALAWLVPILRRKRQAAQKTAR